MSTEPTLEGKSRFSLFAYGSLRTTGDHHDIVKPYLLDAQKATLGGNVHRRKDEYWTVRDVRACWTGSMDLSADISRLASTTGIGRVHHEFDIHDEPIIEGEVLYLQGGAALLSKLDKFEGFYGEPGAADNEYLRVAVRVSLGAHNQPCFCYVDAKTDPNAKEGKVGRFLGLSENVLFDT